MIKIYYAVQTFDGGNRKPDSNRYVQVSKKEITVKCITSLLDSIDYMFEAPKLYSVALPTSHVVDIFDDHSTSETLESLHWLANHYRKDNFEINIHSLTDTGYINSMKTCWLSMATRDTDLVYQVPDDYLFIKTGIYEMVDIFYQINGDIRVSPFVIPFHHSLFHRSNEFYMYKIQPRMLVSGKLRYWTNTFNLYSTFMTSKIEFVKHLDAYLAFLDKDANDPCIDDVLNDLIRKSNVLAMVPVNSVALHLDDENHMDPYIDWKQIWNSVPKIM